MRYKNRKAGEWVQPRRRGFYFKCCDCGLVHRMNFRIVADARGNRIQFQAFRVTPMAQRAAEKRKK